MVVTLILVRDDNGDLHDQKGHLRNAVDTEDRVEEDVNFIGGTGFQRDLEGYARAIDGHALQVSREDIADILQMANGAENLFIQQHNILEDQQRVTNKFYNTADEVDDRFKPKRFHREEKDEYGFCRDDHGHARDVDGHIIRVSKDDIRNLLERASMDENSYICLPGNARKDIASMQAQRTAKATTLASIDKNIPTSIDRDLPKSIDDEPSPLNPMKSQPDSYTRAEIDQMVEEIYRTLGAAEERLDKRCDDIYFPWDITISSLTSQTEAMHNEIVD
ncbi:hypothetical protein DY000_02048973 [Brassica cretica]|uniref:Uncharacterized protein n=1 Tax=Brassica cretica TaxID=69181 RepID=A0ABQ7ENZ9_BRACR|nr:hypothetical protein DY000_02048973 [Brassica cretica]